MELVKNLMKGNGLEGSPLTLMTTSEWDDTTGS